MLVFSYVQAKGDNHNTAVTGIWMPSCGTAPPLPSLSRAGAKRGGQASVESARHVLPPRASAGRHCEQQRRRVKELLDSNTPLVIKSSTKAVTPHTRVSRT